MDEQNIENRLATLEANDKTLFKQIEDLRVVSGDINRIAIAVERLVVKMEAIEKKLSDIEKRIDEVERAPADDMKYYKRLVTGCIITGVLGAVVGAIFGGLK